MREETRCAKIKKRIVNNDFRPGMRLKEARLTERLQTSRAPVRKALRQMKADGLAIKESNKGFSAGQMSIEEFYEICVLREKLESHAAKLTSQRISSKEMQSFNRIYEAYKRFSQEEVSVLIGSMTNFTNNSCNHAAMRRFNEFSRACRIGSGRSAEGHVLRGCKRASKSISALSKQSRIAMDVEQKRQ